MLTVQAVPLASPRMLPTRVGGAISAKAALWLVRIPIVLSKRIDSSKIPYAIFFFSDT